VLESHIVSPDPSDDPVPIPQVLVDAMVAHAREVNPDECCGVVLRFPDGAQKLYRTTNAAEESQRPFRFDIPAGELLHLYRLMSDHDADHYIVYHSHTMTEARPSPTDLRFARPLVGADAWPYWLLVSLATEPPVVRVWRIVEARDDDSEAVNGVKPVEVGFTVVPLPPGSELLQLRTGGEERRPVVSESPLTT
jgi:proteasome lid subunit RPN8/RPN11